MSGELYKIDFIYGTKKFIPPVYTVWRRNLFGKLVEVTKTENPMPWANENVLLVCDTGMMIGTEDLIDQFKSIQPKDE